MTDSDVQDLLRTIKSGETEARIIALFRLSNSRTTLNEDVTDILSEAFAGDSDDGNIRVWAAIALARLGATKETVSDFLLSFLELVAPNPDQMSEVGLQEQEVAHALSAFREDVGVTIRLINIVNLTGSGSASDDRYHQRIEGLIDDCLQALGALGHEESIDFLKLWRDQGNRMAAAALRRSGGSWDDIDKPYIEADTPEEVAPKFYEMCEANPDDGIAAIESFIEDNPKFRSDSAALGMQAYAYVRKGMQAVLQNQHVFPDLNYQQATGEQLRSQFGVTDEQLDCLERVLLAYKRMEELDPELLTDLGQEAAQGLAQQIDSAAIVLERCRPGRVQSIWPGRTKLLYFGSENILAWKGLGEHINVVLPFLRIHLLGLNNPVSSAMVLSSGTDARGRKYVTFLPVERPLKEFGQDPNDELGDFGIGPRMYLFDDDTCGFGLPKNVPIEDIAKKSFFGKLFGR